MTSSSFRVNSWQHIQLLCLSAFCESGKAIKVKKNPKWLEALWVDKFPWYKVVHLWVNLVVGSKAAAVAKCHSQVAKEGCPLQHMTAVLRMWYSLLVCRIHAMIPKPCTSKERHMSCKIVWDAIWKGLNLPLGNSRVRMVTTTNQLWTFLCVQR